MDLALASERIKFRRFIGEVLLIVPDILATRDSAWISSTFSVIKHV
jgi:hypothetical protein